MSLIHQANRDLVKVGMRRARERGKRINRKAFSPEFETGKDRLEWGFLFRPVRFQDVIILTDHYPQDAMSETLCARPLALFKLGRCREAAAALKKAIRIAPLVAKELLKKSRRVMLLAGHGFRQLFAAELLRIRRSERPVWQCERGCVP
jgi:hypothetical protein